MVAGQILNENLDHFVTTLSWIIGYSLDEDDWERINTDWLDGGGGSYDFVGNHRMTFGFSVHPKKEMVDVTVELPAALESQVELAIAIFQHFQLRKRRG
jgi:hypothetical protein